MPKPFSIDLRQRILNDVLAGMTYAEAARKYSVSAEFVRQFHRRFQATQEVAPRPPIPRVVPFHQRHETTIREAVSKNPSLTLEQLRSQLGLDVSIGTLWHALQKLKLSFKKKRSMRPSSNDRMSSASEPNSTSSAPRASTRTG
jgi:transposase